MIPRCFNNHFAPALFSSLFHSFYFRFGLPNRTGSAPFSPLSFQTELSGSIYEFFWHRFQCFSGLQKRASFPHAFSTQKRCFFNHFFCVFLRFAEISRMLFAWASIAIPSRPPSGSQGAPSQASLNFGLNSMRVRTIS